MNNPLYKEYAHDFSTTDLREGDKILIVEPPKYYELISFYTATCIEFSTKYISWQYTDEETPSSFRRGATRDIDIKFYILRLLPQETFGEAILYSQLSNEYIHLMIALGYTGKLKDIDDDCNKRMYIDGIEEQHT